MGGRLLKEEKCLAIFRFVDMPLQVASRNSTSKRNSLASVPSPWIFHAKTLLDIQDWLRKGSRKDGTAICPFR